MNGNDWKPNQAGVLIPPSAAAAHDVVPVKFAVKVQGFAPPMPVWQSGGASQFTGHIMIRPVEKMRRSR